MTLVDLLSMPSVSDPRLSPDGRQVVFVRSDADWERNRAFSHVWRVNADGSGAVQLTNGVTGERSPRWSPDGARVAFLADRPATENTQVHVIENAGGEARVLTRHPTSVSGIAWSPDGRFVYFLAEDDRSEEEKARERREDDVYAFEENLRHRHLWRADSETGAATRITEGDFTVTAFTLSRDGTRIAHHRSPTALLDSRNQSEIWVMDVSGGDARRITSNDVPESGARLSPDNRRVLFTADANERFEPYYSGRVFLAPADGSGVPSVLPTGPDMEVAAASWSADGRAVYVLGNLGVRQELFRVDVESGRVTRLTEGDHAVSHWTYHPGPDTHVFAVQDRTNAGDVFTLAMTGGVRPEPRPVTRLFEDLETRFLLPRQEAVRWRGADGVEVEGLLFLPLGFREGERHPLVVQTHGGPRSSDRFGFGSAGRMTQVLAALGYVVFQPNYRGSTGYGDDFLRDMVGGYFRQSHLDVMTGVDHLVARGLVDEARMAKMGWSAGGHMTNWIVTHTDRFKAAASGAGAANWVSMYAQSDVRQHRAQWFGGTPWRRDAPIDVYWEHSPLGAAANVTTPTLFLVGERDERVPMPQSVEMFRALKANGVPTHLYVAPREGHGWTELRHQLFRGNVQLEWFERWVRGKEYTWERAPEAK